jgi:hypothetical protein
MEMSRFGLSAALDVQVFGGDQRTWKTVLLKDGKTGNIINFYNDVFMEQYKDYMLTWVRPSGLTPVRLLRSCCDLILELSTSNW